ncbi:homoserine O-acetyltransferase MetX [Phormidium sp. CCY1219]|uniref:homoserine O-acetyltransferase MetX n=1 Tax=Phormidium sp. CCY1219 TaxID=2886104 RepID=UPI002D1E7E78|nr:homoserine O-acetyltransferase [Phormidium sp. CCY1219]MEB3826422.1 homoserine O-acetyltransferase [Phormidium sp. CCY1219]
MKYQWFISPETQFCELPRPVILESGEVLMGVQVAYRTWGELNATGDNAVVICHALTGWADADRWWEPLIGPGKALDPERDFIICSNVLGSCYGTTGPISVNPTTGCPYGPDFPRITIRDMVRVQEALLETLGVETVQLAIGGSLGGMQVLEWAALYPEKVEAIASIAACGRHSAWAMALGEAQRQTIYADPHWREGYYTIEQPPASGMAAARMMAMCTYRSWPSFEQKCGREKQEDGRFAISSYLQYQGEKFLKRFDANTYITLSHAMDAHDVSRGVGDYHQALASIQQPALIVSIDSDVLYPPTEQQELASYLPNAKLAWLHSPHGHDAFLIEMEHLNNMVFDFRTRELHWHRRNHSRKGLTPIWRLEN